MLLAVIRQGWLGSNEPQLSTLSQMSHTQPSVTLAPWPPAPALTFNGLEEAAAPAIPQSFENHSDIETQLLKMDFPVHLAAEAAARYPTLELALDWIIINGCSAPAAAEASVQERPPMGPNGALTDIGAWLQLIGFPVYIDLFRSNKIDMENLCTIKVSLLAFQIACLLVSKLHFSLVVSLLTLI